jgi:hypothetical protein
VVSGFFLEAVRVYWEETHLLRFGWGSEFKFYEQLGTVSYFLWGLGVLLVGVGSSLLPRGALCPSTETAHSYPTRRRFGILLVLAGATAAATWLVFLGAVEEESFQGVNLHLPIWFLALDGLLLGLGLGLWGGDWFLCRAS